MVRDILELGSSLGFLDEIYEELQQRPDTVDASWRTLFDGEARPTNGTNGNGHPRGLAPTPTARAP